MDKTKKELNPDLRGVFVCWKIKKLVLNYLKINKNKAEREQYEIQQRKKREAGLYIFQKIKMHFLKI